MALRSDPRFTLSAGKARYQKPVNIRESGASRCGESAVDMDGSQRITRTSGHLVIGSLGDLKARQILSLVATYDTKAVQITRSADDPMTRSPDSPIILLLNSRSCIVITQQPFQSNNEPRRISIAAFGLGHRFRGPSNAARHCDFNFRACRCCS